MRLILGSGSPRRRELLAQIGVVPDEIRAPDVDETPLKGELPRDYCNRIVLNLDIFGEIFYRYDIVDDFRDFR